MENLSLYNKIAQIAAKETVVVATVVEASGATPRSIGAKMAVLSNGEIYGTIGGGCVESKVKQAAMRLFQSGAVLRHVTSPLVGLPGNKECDVCGGCMNVLLEKLTPSRLQSQGKNLTLLVMAAGIGSRYGGNKQIEPLGPTGELLLEYSISDAAHAGFNHVALIIRPELREQCEPYVARWNRNFGVTTTYIYQEISKLPPGVNISIGRTKPWGTAHAVWCAKEAIQTPFAVINADDFYGRESYELIANFLNHCNPGEQTHAMAAFQIKNTLSENGPVSRGICQLTPEGLLERVMEHTKLEAKNGKLYNLGVEQPSLNLDMPVSMNIWGFTPAIFNWFEQGLASFLQSQTDLSKVEYYIPLAIDQGLQKNILSVSVLHTQSKWLGITYREDVALVKKQLYPLQLE